MLNSLNSLYLCSDSPRLTVVGHVARERHLEQIRKLEALFYSCLLTNMANVLMVSCKRWSGSQGRNDRDRDADKLTHCRSPLLYLATPSQFLHNLPSEPHHRS